MANKIKLKGDPRCEEAVAIGIITPGQLIKLDSAGKVLRHAAANGRGECLVAYEDALQGKTIADDYAVGDIVFYYAAKAGDVLNLMIDTGETIVIGDPLRSAGNGNFEKATADTDRILAWAEEAVDLAQTGDVATRIAARVA